MISKLRVPLVIALALTASCCSLNSASAELKLEVKLRNPVALVRSGDGKFLYVANQRSGSISVVDLNLQQVVAETVIGKRLSDLTALPGRNAMHLIATDEATHEVILLEARDVELKVLTRRAISPFPVSVRTTNDGSRCFVASLWSRRLTILDIDLENDSPTFKAEKTVSLPFAPRLQLPVKKDAKVIVADSFGGYLAVVDAQAGDIDDVEQLPAHNIRGLALSADGTHLLVSHQILSSLAHTTTEDIHWGGLMMNIVRRLSLESVLDKPRDILEGSRPLLLGLAERAAGDPAGIAVAKDGTTAIAFSGMGELAWGTDDGVGLTRFPAGVRPTAVLLSDDGSQACVSDSFGDAVLLMGKDAASPRRMISLGPQPELTLTQKGERLFYDARLSLDGWMSCHSCHTDGHTNGMLNDSLGDDSFGAPKRVLSLLGTSNTGPWAWNGKVPDLETQIRKSVRTTMRGAELPEEQVAAMSTYLRSLAPAPPIELRPTESQTTAIERGRQVFVERNCHRCHVPPTYTSPATYDVGLKDELGSKQFNPPSLRGLSQRDAYFHDNRANSLEDVLGVFKHQLTEQLSRESKADLIAFLRSL